MSVDSAESRRSRSVATAVAVLCVGAAITAPPARSASLGLAPGDVTLAIRFALMVCASFAGTVALVGPGIRAAGLALCVLSPALMFLPGFPALLAPLGLVPFYAALLRSTSNREAVWLGGIAGACQALGAAGWIYQYFSRPWVPGVIALSIFFGLWAPLAAATRVLVSRSTVWVPVAAVLAPLSEWLRSEWMRPPLPGLSIAQANADTVLAGLASWSGEAGVSWVASTLGLAGAVLIASGRPWIGRYPRCFAALLVACAALAASRPASDLASDGDGSRTRVCAVRDPTRTAGDRAFGDGGDAAIFALAERAEALGCEIVVFPEYSVELGPTQLLPASWAVERLAGEMTILGGASVHHRQQTEPRHWLQNVVCRFHLGPGRQINCAGGFDKLVLAPFGEVGLFQDLPAVSRLGSRISLLATQTEFAPLRSPQPVGVLPIGDGRRSGVAICWEILVPHIFESRGVAGRRDVDLLTVVSDLGGFGDSAAAIDLFRRAAVLQAISLDAPLLFASTHAPFFVNRAGRLVQPVHQEAFFVAWEIALGRAAAGQGKRTSGYDARSS